jgi:hypothetical protein
MSSKRPSLKALERRPTLPLPSVPEPEERIAAPPSGKQPPSRTGKKVVSVYLPESVWRDLKVLGAKNDTTIDALIRRGIDHVFTEYKVNRGASEN